jgi:hypothetical protein
LLDRAIPLEVLLVVWVMLLAARWVGSSAALVAEWAELFRASPAVWEMASARSDRAICLAELGMWSGV